MGNALTGYENYPVNFQAANKRQTKPLMIVVEIEDVTNLLALGPIYEVVHYGDANIVYGTQGLVYGALKLKTNVNPYITLQGSLQISQKLEPEQGKAAISTFELVLLDKDGDITKLISPGIVVNEVMGGKEIKIRLGYADTAYPEDYFIIFRGSATSTKVQGPAVTITLSDPHSKKKTSIFDTTASSLTASIADNDVTIPIANTGGFYQRVLGPDGTYDSIIKTYIKIEDEFMEYTDITSSTSLTVTRPTITAPFGYNQTAAVAHDNGSDVNPFVSIGPVNSLELVLKVMLSGWEDNWIDSIPCFALGTDFGLSSSTSVIALPLYKDAKVDYGLVAGDYVTVSNSTTNNGTYVITSISNDKDGSPNRIIYINTSLTEEVNLGALLAFRSKYDTLPSLCGLMMTPREVDVEMFEYLQQYFFSTSTYDLTFGISEKESNAKDWIDSQIMMATKCYSLTRFGRVSVGYARPPSTISSKLIALNQDNIVDPNQMLTTRAMTNRRFYNQIIYNYDYNGNNSKYGNVHKEVSATSVTNFRCASTLTINSKGARTSYSTGLLAQRVAYAILQRFSNAAYEISLNVNFGTGILIESGDIVLLQDNGTLKIPNFLTGERDIGEKLFEIVDRKINIVSGVVNLTLLAGIVDTRKDRYGSIAPSSTLAAGSTETILQLINADESNKWSIHAGKTLYLHDLTFSSYSATCTLTDVNANNLSQLVVTGLTTAPPIGTVLEVDPYPTSTDPTIDSTYKEIYAFLSPTLSVISGISNTQFTVSSSDAAKLNINSVVLIHDITWGTLSPEVSVTDITGTTITVGSTLTFTPSSGQFIDFVGFADKNGAYRLS